MRWACRLAMAAATVSVAGGAAETNPAAAFAEFSAIMERLRRNETDRLRADVEAERLRRERERLAADQAASEARREQLQAEIHVLREQVAAPRLSPWPSNALLMAMSPVALLPTEGPARPAEPLTVVELVEPSGPDGMIRVRLGDREYRAEGSAFAMETEILSRLERRLAALDLEATSNSAAATMAEQTRAAVDNVRRAFRSQGAPASATPPAGAAGPRDR